MSRLYVQMSPQKPLAGLKVLDLSRIVAGPYAAMLLADLGATVLKVESPHDPDAARSWGPPFVEGEMAPHFAMANRGKGLILLDIKEDRERLQQLIAAADVVIENFKHGSLPKLGIHRSDLLLQHPHLVWATITGYGSTGPLARRAGYDGIAQAAGGLMSLSGHPETGPMKMASPIIDQSTALFLVTGILAKLHERARTGLGGLVEANLFASAVSLVGPYASAALHGHPSEQQLGNSNAFISPFGCYPCAGDTHLMMTVGSDAQFLALAGVLGIEEYDVSRYAEHFNRKVLRESVDALIGTKLQQASAHEWELRLGAVGIACSVVNSVDEALAHPQTQALGLVDGRQVCTPVFLEGEPLCAAGAPPRLQDALPFDRALAYLAGAPAELSEGPAQDLPNAAAEPGDPEGIVPASQSPHQTATHAAS